MPYQTLGYGYTWWRDDPLPALVPVPGLRVELTSQYALLAELADLSLAEVQRRADAGHQPYLAYVEQHAAAYGWSATQHGAIDELDLRFEIPAANRYLWDFVTLPDWRGQGIYAHLLQAILHSEAPEATRFWIGHTADNAASRRGIIKAGFQEIETLVRSPNGSLHIMPRGTSGRAMVSPMALHRGTV